MIRQLASNLELKARDPDPRLTLAAAKAAGAVDQGTFEQRDIFFWLPTGRLKLRRQGERAELILYTRPDRREPTASWYRRVSLADPQRTEEQLDAHLGRTAVVEKRRRQAAARPPHQERGAERRAVMSGGRLLRRSHETKDNLRIHLDEVSGLGCFVELEAVAPLGMRPEAQLGEINAMRRALGITDERLLAGAYADYVGEIEVLNGTP